LRRPGQKRARKKQKAKMKNRERVSAERWREKKEKKNENWDETGERRTEKTQEGILQADLNYREKKHKYRKSDQSNGSFSIAQKKETVAPKKWILDKKRGN